MYPPNQTVRILPVIAVLVGATTIAAASADEVPLPRPRPAITEPTETPAAPPQAAPAQPSACQVGLGARAAFAPLAPLVGPGECGAPDVVQLNAILMPNHTWVALTPPATLRCGMAQAVVEWVRQDIGPAAGALGAPLTVIENYDSYDCRGMNRVVGAKLSEHGRANALDVRSVTIADGKAFHLTDPAVSREFRERLRTSACARFMTVLGPGSDGYHEQHVHVDLAERRNDYRICQWDIREPGAEIPLPRPRPSLTTSEQKP